MALDIKRCIHGADRFAPSTPDTPIKKVVRHLRQVYLPIEKSYGHLSKSSCGDGFVFQFPVCRTTFQTQSAKTILATPELRFILLQGDRLVFMIFSHDRLL
jgi:hypothetical protein